MRRRLAEVAAPARDSQMIFVDSWEAGWLGQGAGGVVLVGLGVVIMKSFGWLEAEAALEDMPWECAATAARVLCVLTMRA